VEECKTVSSLETGLKFEETGLEKDLRKKAIKLSSFYRVVSRTDFRINLNFGFL